MTLADLGWNDFFEATFHSHREDGWIAARLIRDNKISYGALTVDEDGDFEELEVILSGKVYHDAETDAELPAVGDWVALDLNADEGADAVIRARLPRQTCFSRKAAGESAARKRCAPWSISGSHMRRPRKGRLSSGERSAGERSC